MPLLTGEEIPEMIQSRKERSLFCWIKKGDVEFEVLDGYKKYANAGVYAKVMGQFIVYILKNYDKIQAEIQRIFERYRREAIAILDEGLHNRAPSNYADMMLGFHYFLKFCFTEGNITKKQANEIREYHAKNLIDLLNIQPILHETKDFKKLVKAKLSNVICHGGFELLKIDSRMNDGVTGKYPANFVGWQDYGEHIFYIQSDRANLIIKQLPKELKKIMGCGEKSFWSNMV